MMYLQVLFIFFPISKLVYLTGRKINGSLYIRHLFLFSFSLKAYGEKRSYDKILLTMRGVLNILKESEFLWGQRSFKIFSKLVIFAIVLQISGAWIPSCILASWKYLTHLVSFQCQTMSEIRRKQHIWEMLVSKACVHSPHWRQTPERHYNNNNNRFQLCFN